MILITYPFLKREYPNVLKRMAEIGHKNLATTIMNVEKQIQGRFAVIKQETAGPKLIQAYLDLQYTLGYFTTLQVLPFNALANVYFESLRRQKIRIGTYDLRIAAIALSVQGIFVTRNQKDFGQVPGLVLEDWSAVDTN